VNGEIGYVVRRGQIVRPEFTYENNGRTTVTSAPLGYYISANDFISATDRRIASTTITLVRDTVSTLTRAVTIPANLLVNRNYWLGVMVNPGATVAEQNRSNNATYIPIRVVP
jgi:hypothetical protein